jgi:hypothetical protein
LAGSSRRLFVNIGATIGQHKFFLWHGKDCQLSVEPQAQSPSGGGTERQLEPTQPLVLTSSIRRVIIVSRSEEYNLLPQE